MWAGALAARVVRVLGGRVAEQRWWRLRRRLVVGRGGNGASSLLDMLGCLARMMKRGSAGKSFAAAALVTPDETLPN